ncbi:MAG: type II toxin-antitoxin system RelE/ParE family toxin [Rhodocyclaceae bacterium]|jgi:addiction module RelE/StbE family toxin|nr:type II toxin-antitoxin system RelE/ParE family toxin [Rhodocyclaceae bacterium]MDO9600783.1 type II toxin-antitoxin system RelE/ParE family toxin [Rhodocyclaceae bacterium]MDP2194851.1 type II toxin-antitoxin system RelE/ParE family toxin [Rhodocyclaceae bacterium]
MTRVAWLQAALDDLRGIHDYIARDNPTAARQVIKAVRNNVKILQDHPACGRPGRIEGTRELVVGRYPYIVAYRQTAQTLEILAVVHTSRLWPESLP